jgi:hypothetical protein
MIENRDAILKMERGGGKSRATRAEWPEANFIIGNPPFLGAKLFREHGLTDEYVRALHRAFELPKESDLCCYWFDLANKSRGRAGLLATQGIRGAANREVLQQIKGSGAILFGTKIAISAN